jgi:uncharacterized Fe-S center protein
MTMQELIFIERDLDKLKTVAEKELSSIFSNGEKIAIKLHMGEAGNEHYLKPEFVKVVIDVLKGLGVQPFIFDSPVVYPGGRDAPEKYLDTAKEHGYSEESMGCPITISNESINVKEKYLEYHVCKDLVDADGVLVLTHAKGHTCSGYGGAIKNIGMGALTKESKGDIHDAANPKIIGECVGCNACVKACPVQILSLEDNKIVLNNDSCIGCSICIQECKFDVLKPKIEMFDILLAEGANAAHKNFKKSYYINAIINISKKCDCFSDMSKNPIILEDVGILFGKDIVSIEKASLDLINKKYNGNLFLEHNNKDPYKQVNVAAEIGMGELDYTLK